jgi:uncharacterized paraquat-inducible protein A
MNTHFDNLRLGTRLLVITLILGIQNYVFRLPFDFLPLIVILASITSVWLEYKIIHPALHKQTNNTARQKVAQGLNRLGQWVMLAGIVVLITAQFEKTTEQVSESAGLGNTLFITGLTITISAILSYSRYRAYQAELTKQLE